jgi:hypothetical protein
LEFLIFQEEKQFKEKKKIKNEKTIYTGKLPTSKRRTRKSFWVFSYITTGLQLIKLEGKTEKKQGIFLGFLKVFQTHKKKARK